jgi:hypothetical protein
MSDQFKNKVPKSEEFQQDFLEPRYPEYVSKSFLTTMRLIFLIPHFLLWIWLLVYEPFHIQFVFMILIGNTTALISAFLALLVDNKGKSSIMKRIKSLT